MPADGHRLWFPNRVRELPRLNLAKVLIAWIEVSGWCNQLKIDCVELPGQPHIALHQGLEA